MTLLTEGARSRHARGPTRSYALQQYWLLGVMALSDGGNSEAGAGPGDSVVQGVTPTGHGLFPSIPLWQEVTVAVAFDAVGPSSTAATGTASPLTWSHTCGASATELIVGVAVDNQTDDTALISAVTYNGVSMTSVLRWESGGSTFGYVQVFRLHSPPAGANTVSVTVTGGTPHRISGGSVSFTGSSTVSAAVHADSNQTVVTSGSIAIPSTSSGNMVIAVTAGGSSAPTFTAGTSRYTGGGAGFGAAGWTGAATAPGTGSNVTISFTQVSDWYGAVGIEIQGSTATTWNRTLTTAVTAGASFGGAKPGPAVKASVAAHVTAGGTKTGHGALTAKVTASVSLNSGPPYIAGLAGSGYTGYFADQHGSPRIWLMEMMWGLPGNAGRWNGGDWRSDFDTYFSTRAAQGFTAWWGIPWINHQIDPGAPFTDGRSWDGVYPLTANGTPGRITSSGQTLGLNDTYWQRIDYMVSSALKNGIMICMNLGMSYDTQAGWMWGSVTSAQAQAFGAAVAARYPQSTYPNLQWAFGDDDWQANEDALFTSIWTGITGAGDTRNAMSKEQYPETNSHVEFDNGAIYVPGGFGVTYCQYNFIYSYDPTYLGVEASYKESGTTPIPVVYGDGIWYGDSDNSTYDYTERRVVWWALSSGARGIDVTSGGTQGDIWRWQSDSAAELTSDATGTFVTSTIKKITDFYTSLPGWHQLVADTSNALVTAGRGTRSVSDSPNLGDAADYGNTDNYVTASRTADGKLAVIYCGQHFSITIDQTKMVSGYTATWVDPSNPAVTAAATTGSTYSSTSRGNNAAGNPDWLLVLQAPAPVTHNAVLTDTVTAAASFGGKKTALSHLTAAVTAKNVIGGTRTRFGHLTSAATARAVLGGAKTALGHLTAAVTARAFIATGSKLNAVPGLTSPGGTVPGQPGPVTAKLVTSRPGSLTTTATARALFGGTRTALGHLTESVSASASFSGTKGKFGHVTAVVTAHGSLAGMRTQFGHVTAAVTAHFTAAGADSGHLSGSVTAGVTARTVFSGVKSARGHLTAAVTAVTSFISSALSYRPPLALGINLSQVAYSGTTTVNVIDGADAENANDLACGFTQADYAGTAVVAASLLGISVSQVPTGGNITVNTFDGSATGWTMQNVELSFAEFNDVVLSTTITNSGSALNLTGMSVNMTLKKAAGTADSDPSTVKLSSSGPSPQITITNASAGQCKIAVPHADAISTLKFYRIDVVDTSGSVNTAAYGAITYTNL